MAEHDIFYPKLFRLKALIVKHFNGKITSTYIHWLDKTIYMGQFLAVGLALKVSTPVQDGKKISLGDVVERMTIDWGFDSTLYDFETKDNSWVWQLKPAVLENDLPPFLEQLYPMLYGAEYASDTQEILAMLKTKSREHWLEESYESFQYDSYAQPYSLYLTNKPFRPRVVLYFDAIILAMSEKILLESPRGLFRFFEKMIPKNFPGFPLAKAVKVYITG